MHYLVYISSNIDTFRPGFLRWWSVVECGGVWWSVVECGGVWWSVVECGGVWWSVVECGGVWWRSWRHSSLAYVIIICNDVTRESFNKDGQNLLTKHFLASPHVCDTMEGLRLACYEQFESLTWQKLLLKLIYSRVIAVSLLEKDNFPQVYWRIFRMFTKL
jgi:hypothetical protein